MKRHWKKIRKFIVNNPIKFSLTVCVSALITYALFAYVFRLGINMEAGTAISTDIALITIIVTSIGLSISGYIFLNNYFGTVIEGDQSLTSIIEELNKTYIFKIVLASIASAVFIAFGFLVVFIVKENEGGSGASAFTGVGECILQHLVYTGSIGTILYNFHFLCHIINPEKLIKKRAAKVVDRQIVYFVKQYEYLPCNLSVSGGYWKYYKDNSRRDSIRYYGAKGKDDVSEQTLGLIKYIHEIESIITKVIELNAIKGRNRSKEEALKFVFADTSVGSIKYERRTQILCIEDGILQFPDGAKDFGEYEKVVSDFIEKYAEYYDHLVLLRNALIKMDKENVRDLQIPKEVSDFIAMMLRITLNQFSNFVKITELNIGGGYFQRACFNWSDLSDSNLTGSDFFQARMERSVFVNSDMSNSKLDEAVFCDADLKNVNLGYASLIGADCTSVNLTNAKLTDITFHERSDIVRNIVLKEKIGIVLAHKYIDWKELKRYTEKILNLRVRKKTNLSAATLDYVMLKSVDLSLLKLWGASFTGSVLTNSLWLHTTEAAGLKMQDANLRNSLAVHCNFSMSDYRHANLGQAVFVDTDMHQSSLSEVSGFFLRILGSSETVLTDKNGKQDYLVFWDPMFADKDFRNSQIIDPQGFSNWTQVNFQRMNAVESQWYNTIINEGDFKEAVLKNAIFHNIAANWVNMEKCDLTYAKLYGVSFRVAKMISTVFTRGLLENVSFEDANLYGSNFVHASISKTRFIGCSLNRTNFSHTIIQKSVFSNCDLDNLYLQSTTFKEVVFDESSFRTVLNLYKKKNDITLISCMVKSDNIQELFADIRTELENKGAVSFVLQKNADDINISVNGK